MEKRDKEFNEEDLPFLKQLIDSLEESLAKLEEYFGKKDYENYNKSRRLIIDLQKKISNIIK